jgi:hypothetical protein
MGVVAPRPPHVPLAGVAAPRPAPAMTAAPPQN